MRTKKSSTNTVSQGRGRPFGSRSNMDEVVKWKAGTKVTDAESFRKYLTYLWKMSNCSVGDFLKNTKINNQPLNEQTLFALMNLNRDMNPTLKVIQQICKGFDVSIGTFFEGKAEPITDTPKKAKKKTAKN